MDQHWKDHLLSMDHMKEGINLRAYAQKDPLTEYKRESFNLFEEMRINIKRSVVENIYNVQLYTKEEIEEIQRQHQAELEAQLENHRRMLEAEENQERMQQAEFSVEVKKWGVTTHVHVAQERSSSTVTEPNKIQ